MRLDFVVVGPQRSGTTWIYEYLLGHPQVFVSPLTKESRFFDLAFDRGMAWYASLFEGAADGQVAGEVAPTYFHDAPARGRLREAFPECTVIAILREPIERLLSLYHHLRRTGRIGTAVTPLAALDSEPLLIETSRYGKHVASWRGAFGADAVHLLRFDQLGDDPDGFAAALCGILGVDAEPASREPAGRSVEPRSYLLSRAVSATSRTLRRWGAHRLVNLGKRMRLRELVVGRQPLDAQIDRAFAAGIWDRVGADLLELERTTGFDLTPWRGRWREMGIEA